MPNPAGPTVPPHYRHFWFDYAQKSFWPFDLQEDHEPLVTLDARDVPSSENRTLVGGRDGYVREFRRSAETDEGFEIESYIYIGPLQLGGNGSRHGSLDDLTFTLGAYSGDASWWVVVGDSPEEAIYSDVVASGVVSEGRNYTARPRGRGQAVYLIIGNGATDRSWTLEAISADVTQWGTTRMP